MKAARSLVIAVGVVVIGAGTAAGFYAKFMRPVYALPNETAPFNSILVGASEDEVTAKLGQPMTMMHNERHETKTADQWRDIASQADALEQRSSDPYGTMTPSDHAKLVDLRRMLEHRIRDSWNYSAPKPQQAQIVFEFDDQRKLLAATVNPIPHMQGAAAAVGKPRK